MEKCLRNKEKKGGKLENEKKKIGRFDLLTSPKLQLQSCHARGNCRMCWCRAQSERAAWRWPQLYNSTTNMTSGAHAFF